MKLHFPATLFLVIAFCLPPPCTVAHEIPGGDEEPVDAEAHLVFVSDTQSPLWPEMVVLAANRNKEARSMIFDAILADDPDAVFHIGDIVALGFWGSSWDAADEFLGRLSKAGIPFFPTRGNHELIFFPGKGEANFASRFPDAPRTGYSRRAGSIGVVLLNSNFSTLNTAEVIQQQQWYEQTLVTLEADTTVRGIIVACHHPPYTNSKIVDPSLEAQERFVPAFLNSKKGVAFMSGHSHAMESFTESEKRFLVIGGGGGLQHPLLTGAEQRWIDEFPVPSEKRMFHYLRCNVTADSVVFSVQMLSDDFLGFHEAYRIGIPLEVVTPP